MYRMLIICILNIFINTDRTIQVFRIGIDSLLLKKLLRNFYKLKNRILHLKDHYRSGCLFK